MCFGCSRRAAVVGVVRRDRSRVSRCSAVRMLPTCGSSTTTSGGRRGSNGNGRGSWARSARSPRRVEHVGSTAVPGLAAKPIVDISVGVDDPDDDAAFTLALTNAGYMLRVIEPEHRMFRTPDRGVHVHVWREGSADQADQLVFRDWLRVHAEDRARYEAVKRELASRRVGVDGRLRRRQDRGGHRDHEEGARGNGSVTDSPARALSVGTGA